MSNEDPKSGGLKPHPMSMLFPSLDSDSLRALADDLKVNGQRDPIVLFEGMILDGNQRYSARQLDTEVPELSEREFAPETEGDPLEFVLSKNLHRRQLTPGQKAAVAVEFEEKFSKEAKGRSLQNLKQNGAVPVGETKVAGRSRDRAAKALGVCSRYVQDAKKVRQESRQLFEAVKSGEKSLREAIKYVENFEELDRQERRMSHKSAHRESASANEPLETKGHTKGASKLSAGQMENEIPSVTGSSQPAGLSDLERSLEQISSIAIPKRDPRVKLAWELAESGKLDAAGIQSMRHELHQAIQRIQSLVSVLEKISPGEAAA